MSTLLQSDINTMFDVLVVTETWLTDKDNVDLYSLEGYCVEFNHRKLNKRGSGVAIYVRNNIKYKICNNLSISD
jgi:exonuclease III